jgi:hypothetical protein
MFILLTPGQGEYSSDDLLIFSLKKKKAFWHLNCRDSVTYDLYDLNKWMLSIKYMSFDSSLDKSLVRLNTRVIIVKNLFHLKDNRRLFELKRDLYISSLKKRLLALEP